MPPVERKFCRFEAPDIRDEQYLIRRAKPTRAYRNWSSGGWHGDQLDEPSCVGFGWSHWLHSSPIRQWLDPSGLYEIAKHYDSWDGTEYDGTSVRAGAKVLQMLGAIGEYRWTWNASHVADHVLAVGPVVIGVDWYVGMSLPNEAGLMSIDGALEGGHCVCLTGYNSRNELFRVKNSWGTSWGKSGYGYLSLADLQVLLAAGGEACVGIETELRR